MGKKHKGMRLVLPKTGEEMEKSEMQVVDGGMSGRTAMKIMAAGMAIGGVAGGLMAWGGGGSIDAGKADFKQSCGGVKSFGKGNVEKGYSLAMEGLGADPSGVSQTFGGNYDVANADVTGHGFGASGGGSGYGGDSGNVNQYLPAEATPVAESNPEAGWNVMAQDAGNVLSADAAAYYGGGSDYSIHAESFSGDTYNVAQAYEAGLQAEERIAQVAEDSGIVAAQIYAEVMQQGDSINLSSGEVNMAELRASLVATGELGLDARLADGMAMHNGEFLPAGGTEQFPRASTGEPVRDASITLSANSPAELHAKLGELGVSNIAGFENATSITITSDPTVWSPTADGRINAQLFNSRMGVDTIAINRNRVRAARAGGSRPMG